MSEEAVADSGFDMDAGVSELGDSLFGPSDESDETPDIEPDNSDPGTDEIPEQSTAQDGETSDIESDKETREAPQSWKKEMREQWASLTPEVQDYIEQRESQMKEGLEKDRGDANLGRMMRDAMAPFSQMIQQSQTDEPTMVRNLMTAHYRLATSPMEERQQLFSQLAKNYGINFDGQQATEVDPMVQQLQNELNSIKSSLNARDQATLQEARQRVEKEVEVFASEHPLFDDVAEDIVPFLNAGLSLDDAYAKAIWANPVTREKEMERLSKEKEETLRKQAKEKAEKAKKAKAANVRGRDTVKAPTGPLGSMEDTLRQTYDEIQQRS